MTYLRVAGLSQLAEGVPLAVEVQGEPVALFLLDGDVYATHDVCTHQYALLSDGYVEDGCVECPLHQAQFDIPTGKALSAPATTDLRCYPVKVEGGDVFVQVDG